MKNHNRPQKLYKKVMAVMCYFFRVSFTSLCPIRAIGKVIGLSYLMAQMSCAFANASVALNDALIELGHRHKISIVFNYDQVNTIQVNKPDEDLSFDESLTNLLSGTGLTYHYESDQIIYVNAVPAGEREKAHLQVAYVNQELDEILVTGYRGSLQRSLERKRNADSIVESVSSEDLGKYPDQNVAESLQRLTGVSVDRSRGEGQFVTVRGFGPQFNTVLYAGRVIASENQGREFSFDVLAAEAISGADVYKSTTAKMPTGGIGATIDLQIPKPLAYKGVKGVYRVEGEYDNLADTISPHLYGLASYSEDTWGALVSVNYRDAEYRVDRAVTQGWFLDDLSYVPDKKGAGDFAHARVPRNFDLRLETGERKRLGGTLVVEWKPQENFHLTVDGLVSDYSISSKIYSQANWTQNGNQAFGQVELNKNNTLIGYSYKKGLSEPTDIVATSQNRPTETKEIGVNLQWSPLDELEFRADYAYSESFNDNGGNNYFVVAGFPNARPQYIGGDRLAYPKVVLENAPELSAARSHLVIFEGDDTRDSINQLRLDFKYSLDGDFLTSVELGLMSLSRTKSQSSYKTPGDAGIDFIGYKVPLPETMFKPILIPQFLGKSASGPWYKFDPHKIADYLWSQSATGSSGGQGGFSPVNQPFDTWTVREDPREIYLQLNGQGELSGIPFTGNLGLRYADTQIGTLGNQQQLLSVKENANDPTSLDLSLSDAMRVENQHRYSNLSPLANLKFNLTDSQNLEFGLSKTLTRPTFKFLTPGLNSYVGRVGAAQAWGGNLDLQPYKSTNIDLAWSDYLDKNNFIGVNYFHKSISDFVRSITRVESVLSGPLGQFYVTRPENSEQYKVEGIEANAAIGFTNGFGFIANYTWVAEGYSQREVDFTNSKAPFEGLSDSYNVILYFENSRWQTRLSYNFRLPFLARSVGEQSQPEMVEGYGQLDFSADYKLSKNISINLDAVNLTQEKRRSYSVFKERLLEYTDSGARYSFGIKGTF